MRPIVPSLPRRPLLTGRRVLARRSALLTATVAAALIAGAGCSGPSPAGSGTPASPRDSASYPTNVAIGPGTAPFHLTLVTLPGGDHAWNVWAAHEPAALDWLGRTAPGFAPAG